MDDLLTQMCYQYNAAFTNSTQLPFTRETNFYSEPSTRLRMLQTLAPWAVRATQAAPGDGSARNTNHFVAYPRVEKAALGPSRSEQMLTAPVLAANCSSFKIEWTWENGLGRSWTGPDGFGTSGAITGAEPIGMYVRPDATQPWFGLDDGTATSPVRPLSSWPRFTNGGAFAPWGAVGFPMVVGGPTSTVICAVEGPVGSNGVIWQTSDSQMASASTRPSSASTRRTRASPRSPPRTAARTRRCRAPSASPSASTIRSDGSRAAATSSSSSSFPSAERELAPRA